MPRYPPSALCEWLAELASNLGFALWLRILSPNGKGKTQKRNLETTSVRV